MGASPGSNNGGGQRKKILENTHKHLTRKEKQEREDAEEKIGQFEKLSTRAPRYLDERARKIYREYAKKLNELSAICQLDTSMFEQYCISLSLYIQAYQAIQEEGMVTGGKKSPYIAIMNDMASSVRSCAAVLGLNVNSRLQLLLPQGGENDDEDDPLSDLF
ncbi:MAG: phage terminase small subunit P27 family [Sporolactobacillus sp.]